MDYTPIVLKNKGVPIEMAETQEIEPGVWDRVIGEDGEIAKRVVHLRITNNTVAEIEETWGSLDKWQDAMEAQPITTIRKTMALALRREPHDIGEAMLDGEQATYTNAIAISWAIANGVDPILASRVLKQNAGLAENQRQVVKEAFANQIPDQASPGKSGSTSGRKRVARSTSSGS